MRATEVKQRFQHGECVQCGKQVTRRRYTPAETARQGREVSRWCDFYGRDWCKASPYDLGECLVPVILEGLPQ
jgi:hypothetical protein